MLCSCENDGRGPVAFSGDGGDRSAWNVPTESYTGTVRGTPVTFQHLNYTTYRITIGNEVVEGEMNTERGFGDDKNATVYVLDIDRPETDQAFFVRYSNGEMLMLDQQRKPLKKARFTKE